MFTVYGKRMHACTVLAVNKDSRIVAASLSEPHMNVTAVREVYVCMVRRNRCAAHTQYVVLKYSAQYRPHVVMFASFTVQAC